MLVRDLRAIIRVPIPTMRDRRHDFALRRNVTAELVSRDSHRQLALPFQQLILLPLKAKPPFRHSGASQMEVDSGNRETSSALDSEASLGE